MLTQYKDRYSTLFRTISIALVCLFLLNDIAYAAPELFSKSSKATLAPPLATANKGFRARWEGAINKTSKPLDTETLADNAPHNYPLDLDEYLTPADQAKLKEEMRSRSEKIKTTLIIPTTNSAEYIRDTLLAIELQIRQVLEQMPDRKVDIVASLNGADQEPTLQVLTEMKKELAGRGIKLYILNLPVAAKAKAMNAAAKFAIEQKTDIIGFIDDDIRYSYETIRKSIDCLVLEPGIFLTGPHQRPIQPPDNASLTLRIEHKEMELYDSLVPLGTGLFMFAGTYPFIPENIINDDSYLVRYFARSDEWSNPLIRIRLTPESTAWFGLSDGLSAVINRQRRIMMGGKQLTDFFKDKPLRNFTRSKFPAPITIKKIYSDILVDIPWKERAQATAIITYAFIWHCINWLITEAIIQTRKISGLYPYKIGWNSSSRSKVFHLSTTPKTVLEEAHRGVAAEKLYEKKEPIVTIEEEDALPEPVRTGFLRYARSLREKLPQHERKIISRLIRAVCAIEGTMAALKLFGIGSLVASVATGHPVLGAVLITLSLISGGVSRLVTLIYYHHRYPDIYIRKELYFVTLIPMNVGFVLTILALLLPEYSMSDVNSLRNIEYKVKKSLSSSELAKTLRKDELEILDDDSFDIARDILKYQKEHLSVPEPFYQKLFRVLSFGMVESLPDPSEKEMFRIRSAKPYHGYIKSIYRQLHAGKRLLYIDSASRLEKLMAALESEFGPKYLRRVYFYDIGEFIKYRKADRLTGVEGDTYVKRMFLWHDGDVPVKTAASAGTDAFAKTQKRNLPKTALNAVASVFRWLLKPSDAFTPFFNEMFSSGNEELKRKTEEQKKALEEINRLKDKGSSPKRIMPGALLGTNLVPSLVAAPFFEEWGRAIAYNLDPVLFGFANIFYVAAHVIVNGEDHIDNYKMYRWGKAPAVWKVLLATTLAPAIVTAFAILYGGNDLLLNMTFHAFVNFAVLIINRGGAAVLLSSAKIIMPASLVKTASHDEEIVFSREIAYFDQKYRNSIADRDMAKIELLHGLSLRWASDTSGVRKRQVAKLIRKIAVALELQERDEGLMPSSVKSILGEITEQPVSFILNELIKNAFDAYARANARSAEPLDGPIRLRVLKTEDDIVIEISDNGVGFSKIVNRPGSLAVKSNGVEVPSGDLVLSGGGKIGLMWSKALVQLHGGRLEILSPGIDNFKTTVRVVIPSSSIRVSFNGGSLERPKPSVDIEETQGTRSTSAAPSKQGIASADTSKSASEVSPIYPAPVFDGPHEEHNIVFERLRGIKDNIPAGKRILILNFDAHSDKYGRSNDSFSSLGTWAQDAEDKGWAYVIHFPSEYLGHFWNKPEMREKILQEINVLREKGIVHDVWCTIDYDFFAEYFGRENFDYERIRTRLVEMVEFLKSERLWPSTVIPVISRYCLPDQDNTPPRNIDLVTGAIRELFGILSPADNTGTRSTSAAPSKQGIASADTSKSASEVSPANTIAAGKKPSVDMEYQDDSLEYIKRMAGELKGALDANLNRKEAEDNIAAYLNTYSYRSLAIVESLNGLLSYGLPRTIAEFFSSRKIWDKTMQSNILESTRVLYSVSVPKTVSGSAIEALSAPHIVYGPGWNDDLTALKKLLSDPDELKKLLSALSEQRRSHTDDESSDTELSPLEYAKREGLIVQYNDFIKICPITESFRRHILIVRGGSGREYQLVVKMPGNIVPRRSNLDAANYSVAADMWDAHKEGGGILKPVAMISAFGEFSLYGNTIAFLPESHPMRAILYEYMDGKRLIRNHGYELNRAYLGRVAKFSGITVKQLERYIAVNVLVIGKRILDSGYIGTDEKGRIDWHLRNFMLTPRGRVYFVDDFESFRKAKLNDAQKREALRHLVLLWTKRYGLEFDDLYPVIQAMTSSARPKPSVNMEIAVEASTQRGEIAATGRARITGNWRLGIPAGVYREGVKGGQCVIGWRGGLDDPQTGRMQVMPPEVFDELASSMLEGKDPGQSRSIIFSLNHYFDNATIQKLSAGARVTVPQRMREQLEGLGIGVGTVFTVNRVRHRFGDYFEFIPVDTANSAPSLAKPPVDIEYETQGETQRTRSTSAAPSKQGIASADTSKSASEVSPAGTDLSSDIPETVSKPIGTVGAAAPVVVTTKGTSPMATPTQTIGTDPSSSTKASPDNSPKQPKDMTIAETNDPDQALIAERRSEIVFRIRKEWDQIKARGAFVFDIDDTLMHVSSLRDAPDTLKALVRLINSDVRVIITTSSESSHNIGRFAEPLYEALGRWPENLEFYTNYPAEKACRISYINGRPSITRYDLVHKNEILHKLILDYRLMQRYIFYIGDGFDLAPAEEDTVWVGSDYCVAVDTDLDGVNILASMDSLKYTKVPDRVKERIKLIGNEAKDVLEFIGLITPPAVPASAPAISAQPPKDMTKAAGDSDLAMLQGAIERILSGTGIDKKITVRDDGSEVTITSGPDGKDAIASLYYECDKETGEISIIWFKSKCQKKGTIECLLAYIILAHGAAAIHFGSMTRQSIGFLKHLSGKNPRERLIGKVDFSKTHILYKGKKTAKITGIAYDLNREYARSLLTPVPSKDMTKAVLVSASGVKAMSERHAALHRGIERIAKPTSQVGTLSTDPKTSLDALDADIQNAVVLKDTLAKFYEEDAQKIVYTIRLDTKRVSADYIGLIRNYYARILASDKVEVRVLGNDKNKGLVDVSVDIGGKNQSNGTVDLKEGRDKIESLGRLVGMVNLAMAVASLPDEFIDSGVEKYRGILDMISNQYELLTGDKLVLPANPKDIASFIRALALSLPPVKAYGVKAQDEFRLMEEKLRSAA